MDVPFFILHQSVIDGVIAFSGRASSPESIAELWGHHQPWFATAFHGTSRRAQLGKPVLWVHQPCRAVSKRSQCGVQVQENWRWGDAGRRALDIFLVLFILIPFHGLVLGQWSKNVEQLNSQVWLKILDPQIGWFYKFATSDLMFQLCGSLVLAWTEPDKKMKNGLG